MWDYGGLVKGKIAIIADGDGINSGMQTSLPEQTRLVRNRRWRRWVIWVCLSVLVTAMLLAGTGAILLHSSGITAEEAEAVYTQLDYTQEHTRAEIELQFGKAHSEKTVNGRLVLNWRFYKHSLSQVDIFGFELHCFADGVVYNWQIERGHTASGKAAWMYRWWLLKQRLGWE